MRKVPPELARKLVAAAESFAADFDDVRMDDVARVSGIPRATLYYYFAGKDEILTFLLDALLADLNRRVSVEVDTGSDTRTRLSTLIRAHLELLARSPAAAQLLLVNIGKLGKLPDLAAAFNDAFLDPVGRILAEGARRGEVASLDASTTATGIVSAVIMAGLHELVIEGSLDTGKLTESLTNLFWSGISAAPRTSARRRSPRT